MHCYLVIRSINPMVKLNSDFELKMPINFMLSFKLLVESPNSVLRARRVHQLPGCSVEDIIASALKSLGAVLLLR